jgi:hypothetical protein
VIHHNQPDHTFAQPETIETNDFSPSPPTMQNVLGTNPSHYNEINPYVMMPQPNSPQHTGATIQTYSDARSE